MELMNDLYGTILAHGPSPGTLLIVLQRVKEEGRVNEALRECIKGLRLYPDDVRIRRLLAECYRELGFFSLAEKEVALTVGNIEELVPVFKMQADLFERQGRHKEACAALEKYLAHFSGDTEAIARLHALKEKEKIPSSRAPSSEEIVSEIATHTLAEIYESQGQVWAAIETYKKLIEQNPEDLRAHERLKYLEHEIHGPDETVKPPKKKHDGAQRMIGILEGWLTSIQEMGSV